jgi:ubiquinone/menaquinone biosynthesis C-methylase UbiE
MNERFADAAAEDMWARRDMVDLACCTASSSAWLARSAATPVAVDLSGQQLATARRLQGRLGPVFPLVQGDAERVPLTSGCCDLVVSEHGALAWCDPERWCQKRPAVCGPAE